MNPRLLRCFLALCGLVLLLSAVGARADIYKWVDGSGKLHFSDQPPARGPAETVKLRINTYTSPKVSTTETQSLAGGSNKVVIYSASWCGVCKKAKAYFRQRQIPFQDYDVENNSRARREFRELGGRGVPIILVGNQRMNGFSAERFEQMYRR